MVSSLGYSATALVGQIATIVATTKVTKTTLFKKIRMDMIFPSSRLWLNKNVTPKPCLKTFGRLYLSPPGVRCPS
jgi:hypothetical protein